MLDCTVLYYKRETIEEGYQQNQRIKRIATRFDRALGRYFNYFLTWLKPNNYLFFKTVF